MTVIQIPLQQNPDLAALVADKEPGDWIMLKASIKTKDDQTLGLRLENCDDCEKPEESEDEEDDMDEDADKEAPPPPPERDSAKLARTLTESPGNF